MLKLLSKYKKTLTVDSILSQFHKTLAELETVVQDRRDEILGCLEEREKILDREANAKLELQRAQAVSDNLKKMLEVK